MAERPDQEAGGNRVRQVPQANPQNIGDDAGRRREIRAIPRPAFPRPFAEDGGDTQLCCSAAGPLRRGPDVAAGAIWVLTAEAIGIPYRRLRRAVSQGLGKPDQRNADHPQSLTTFFGLRRIDDLWRPSLVELGLTARRGFTPCFFFRVPSTVPPSSKPLGHASPIHQQARTSQSAVRLPRHLPV